MTIAANKTDQTLMVGDHAAHHNALANAANGLEGMRFPYDMTLFGPVQTEGALVCPTSSTYAFPGSATTASTAQMLSGLNVTILAAYWIVVWTPGAAACGVELIKADAGPTNIVQIAEVTGSADVTPINSETNVTAPIQTIVTDVTSLGLPTGGANKTIGFRAKGNGASTAPLLYAVRIQMLLGV